MPLSCRPVGVGQLCPCRAAIGRPPGIVPREVIIEPAHEYDAPIRHRDRHRGLPLRPAGTCVHAYPRCAVVIRPPDVVQVTRVRPPAHEYDAAGRQRNAGMVLSSLPPGTCVHAHPCCTTVARSPDVALRAIFSIPSAHEHNTIVRHHDAGVGSSLCPSGTCIHASPCRAVIIRPPDVVQEAVTQPAHEEDTVTDRDRRMTIPIRPCGTCVHAHPRCAVVIRPPDVIFFVIIIPSTHEHDAPVRHRNHRSVFPLRPAGTCVHARPRPVICLVTKEPCPAGRVAGRGIGELDGERRQAAGHVCSKVCDRWRSYYPDVIALTPGVASGGIGRGEADGVGARRSVDMHRVLLNRTGIITKVPDPFDRIADRSIGEPDGKRRRAGGHVRGEVCNRRVNRNVAGKLRNEYISTPSIGVLISPQGREVGRSRISCDPDPAGAVTRKGISIIRIPSAKVGR
ncbi:hypothetical protein DSECCO2_407210 [anaerobic digester metagenome]